MQKAERRGKEQTKAIWKLPEECLRKQIAKYVKDESSTEKAQPEKEAMAFQGAQQRNGDDPHRPEQRDGVPDQDGPKKILSVLKVSIEASGARLSFAHLLHDPPTAQSEEPCFHPGTKKGNGEAQRQ